MAEEDQDAPPKVLVKPVSVILGLISGMGIAVLLQQYAITPLTRGSLILWAIIGAIVFGVVLPTIMLRIYLNKGENAETPKEASE